MAKLNPKVDLYLSRGCGRCPLFDTPQCKVHQWRTALEKLRAIVLDSGLTEELKWGVPVYTWNKKNVVVLGALKENCSIGFFKGSLLSDDKNILTKPGEHTQAARTVNFTDLKSIEKMEASIVSYIQEAIEIEKSGQKVEFKKVDDYEVPSELQEKFNASPSFKKAFEALTPGRQKGYLLHFAQAKQSSTRIARIEKCEPKIREGKGLNDY